MGHTRLGDIPKSKKWDAVVHSVLSSMDVGSLPDSVSQVAFATMDAASAGMERASQDPGLVYSFYLLSRLSVAGRPNSPVSGELPFSLDAQETVYDLLGEVQLAIDDYVLRHGGSTDYSEMAQRAAGEALLDALEPHSVSLFGSGADELRAGLRAISTKSGLANLSQQFFGDFVARFLNFYLSRVTARSIDYQSFRQVLDFNDELRQYSYQSAAIVRDFAASWVAKSEFEGGVSLDDVRRFMAVAATKLSAEIARGEVADGRP